MCKTNKLQDLARSLQDHYVQIFVKITSKDFGEPQ